MIRNLRLCLAPLLCLAAACGNERAADTASAGSAAAAKQTTYEECVANARRQTSRAESVTKARECLRLPDAPRSGTLPPSPGGEDDGVNGEISSLYSPLGQEQCRVLEVDEESESSVSRCPGIAGYALKVLEGDLRVSIDVVAPDGREHPLNYWSVVTSAFSSLGPRAEWRMRGTRPVALIVRVNASEDPEDASRITSYLAVAKVTPAEICVTDRIPPTGGANEMARRAADASAERPCLREAPQG